VDSRELTFLAATQQEYCRKVPTKEKLANLIQSGTAWSSRSVPRIKLRPVVVEPKLLQQPLGNIYYSRAWLSIVSATSDFYTSHKGGEGKGG
jgi:hypothetical protein